MSFATVGTSFFRSKSQLFSLFQVPLMIDFSGWNSQWTVSTWPSCHVMSVLGGPRGKCLRRDKTTATSSTSLWLLSWGSRAVLEGTGGEVLNGSMKLWVFEREIGELGWTYCFVAGVFFTNLSGGGIGYPTKNFKTDKVLGNVGCWLCQRDPRIFENTGWCLLWTSLQPEGVDGWEVMCRFLKAKEIKDQVRIDIQGMFNRWFLLISGIHQYTSWES